MQEIEDEKILALFQEAKSKNKAFELLVQKYQQRLYWHIRKIVISHEDADDVLQNTFIKIWKGLINFRADSKLYTWLYRIGTNESITFLRSKKNMFFKSLEDINNNLENELYNDPYFNGDEIQLKLQKAILTLPEKQRIVFNMKYFDDIKYEDISEILDTSVGALKASYHHAVKKIEKFMTTD